MNNFRFVDKRFCLSGGWQDLIEDHQFLLDNKVGGVLDLQFVPTDDYINMGGAIQAELEGAESLSQLLARGIIYEYIPMYDGGFGQDLKSVYDKIIEKLKALDEMVPDKLRILVKCAMGNSRSPSALAAYLCEKNGWNYDTAIIYIRDRELLAEIQSMPMTELREYLYSRFGGFYV